MKGREIRSIRNQLNLNQIQFGNLLHASWGTVSNWERDESTPAPFQEVLLKEFETAARQRGIRDNIKNVLIRTGVAFALAALLRHLIEPEKPKRRRRKS